MGSHALQAFRIRAGSEWFFPGTPLSVNTSVKVSLVIDQDVTPVLCLIYSINILYLGNKECVKQQVVEVTM